MHHSKPKVVVCGSINMDLVVRTPKLPAPGQTLIAHALTEVPGGKGANQAVAAARLGTSVEMIGCVGDDGFGTSLLRSLQHESIDTQHIANKAGSSGVAVVSVDDSGENSIMVVPGANGKLGIEDVDRAEASIREASWAMTQLEIPIATVEHFVRLCRKHGTKVILNPAPVGGAIPESLFQVDLLCPNQTETALLLECEPPQTVDQAIRAAERLLDRGASRVVITLGSLGAIAAESDLLGRREFRWIEPFSVVPVDTVAAGDAFLGALVGELAKDRSLVEACRYAAAAAAHCVTVHGAQPSLPTPADVQAILRR